MNKYCQNCQQANPPDAMFCRNCAATLPVGQANQAHYQPNLGERNFAQTPANSGGASQRATVALILAIAGFVCCFPLASIAAAIVGWLEITAIKQGQASPAGMNFAQIGLWGGIIITVLQIGAFIFWVLFSMMAATSDPYYY